MLKASLKLDYAIVAVAGFIDVSTCGVAPEMMFDSFELQVICLKQPMQSLRPFQAALVVVSPTLLGLCFFASVLDSFLEDL